LTTATPCRRNRNFGRLLAASGLSNLADGIFQITLPLVALGITRDPGAFASVTLVGRLPWLLFSLPAGALADRLDRRRTMMLVNLARAALIGALALAVAVNAEELWLLYAVAFGLGVGETLFDTAAQSILPNIVTDPDHLSKANGRLYAVELSANNFIGPPLGGLVAGVTLAGALAGSSAAYALAAVILMLLVGGFRPVRAADAAPPRMRTDIVEGVRYLARHRLLRTLAVCVGISNLSSTALFAVFPLHAIRPGPLDLTSAWFGVLLATLAAGSVVGSLFVDRLERRLGRRRTLLLATATFPVYAIVLALTTDAVSIAASFFLGSALNIGWNVITVSLRQRIVPDHLLGRVNAGYRLLAWGTMPIGAALAGVVGRAWGLEAVFWTSAGLGALCFPLVFVVVSDRALTAAEPRGGQT
jgi:MFS family permease